MIYQFNKMENKKSYNHPNTEKALEKFNTIYDLKKKTLKKVHIDGTHLNLIKVIMISHS